MKHLGSACILGFVFLMGAMVGVDRMSAQRAYFIKEAIVPPVVVTGTDQTYTIGDIVTLSVKPFDYPPNMLQLHYDWKVLDPNQPNKNIVRSKDGTTINFGTGSKPGKINVIVNASSVLGAMDSSGNVKDINLQTSGIASFDIIVK